MKITIISDGTPLGTRVLDDKGDPINGISHITWSIDVSGGAKVTLEFMDVTVKAIAEYSE